jgi:hypothetical protein
LQAINVRKKVELFSGSTYDQHAWISFGRRQAIEIIRKDAIINMKTKRFLCVAGVCSVMASISTQAAIVTHQEFTTYQNSGSAEYADFTAKNLSVNYTYTGGTGSFIAESQTTPTTSMAYQTGSQAAGTHGAYQSSSGFTGYYYLSATIQDISGNWEVTGGTLDVYGNLLTGQTVSSGQKGDLLLSVNLLTGLNSINAGVGSGGSAGKEFDFRLGSVTGGSSAIMQDFLGVANGSGDVILNVGGYSPVNTYSDLNKGFGNNGTGQADTFVPEPAMYASVGSVLAVLGLLFVRRSEVFRMPVALQ